jgi:hypothetical protein
LFGGFRLLFASTGSFTDLEKAAAKIPKGIFVPPASAIGADHNFELEHGLL